MRYHYNIKLFKGFPFSRSLNYALEGGARVIYFGFNHYDPVSDQHADITPFATYSDFAPFDLTLNIQVILPFEYPTSTNILASDDAQAIDYMAIEVVKEADPEDDDDVDVETQYIGYYVDSQMRVSNTAIRLSCSLDVLNSIDFEGFIDFKQSIFTRRHKSRIETSYPLDPEEEHPRITNVLKPIDTFPESFQVAQNITKKTDINPDKGLRFAMVQRAINETSGDDVVASHPSWGIVLEPSKYNDEDVITGAYVHEIAFKNKVIIGSQSRGCLSLGLTKKLRQSGTMARYVRIPYFPFNLETNKITINGTDPEKEFYTRIIVSMKVEIPADIYGTNLLTYPRVIKQEPNLFDHASLSNFADFYSQAEYDALTSAQRANNDEILASCGYARDDNFFDYSGMIGLIDKEDQHPESSWLKRDLATLSPLYDNFSSGLANLKTQYPNPYASDEVFFPAANSIIDPKMNHSSLSPISLVFGASSCDVPLETFSNICNDDNIIVNIQYSLATPGNFTFSVRPKSGSFVDLNDVFPCTFSVYPSADMQLTSDAYVSYMRDQRPFDLNIQESTRLGLSYRLAMGMIGNTFNELMSPRGMASYGLSALVPLAKGMIDIPGYLGLYDNIVENQNEKRRAIAQNSSSPVITTSYDVFEGIDNYRARLVEREPKSQFKEEINKEFYYHGYATLERLSSLVKTRWLFDHYRASIVVKPSLNSVLANRLIELFNEGITIIHELPQLRQFDDSSYFFPDYENGLENLETDIQIKYP